MRPEILAVIPARSGSKRLPKKKIYGMSGLRPLRGYKGELKFKPKLIWEIISASTQKLTYRCPSLAFELFCVKTLNVVQRNN